MASSVITRGTPSVAVLLSTYNGERFLEAQLDSLVGQEGVHVEVFARDDGSSDRTLEILNRYSEKWPQLATPLRGSNLGPAGSFLHLAATIPNDFPFYAFCDQDDVWKPDKLKRAVNRLAAYATKPALYCSRVMTVTDDLRPLGLSYPHESPKFNNVLFENVAHGNSVVFSAKLLELIRRKPPRPDSIIMHDWWCALVASAFGNVIFDEYVGVLYRQHGSNALGETSNYLTELVRVFRLFTKSPKRFYPIHAQAVEFLGLYGDLVGQTERDALVRLINSRRTLASRIALACSGHVSRTHFTWNVIARTLIATNFY